MDNLASSTEINDSAPQFTFRELCDSFMHFLSESSDNALTEQQHTSRENDAPANNQLAAALN